ncbi:unnamed protein product, partial [marine sediment metagenome]
MVQFNKKLYKDIGLQREVEDALPYAVVGGAWEGSFENDEPMWGTNYYTALNHIVPTGQQLKVLFMRVWTQATGGSRYCVYQTNPVATGATGTVEAYPVVGNTPSGARDYPMLEAAGAEILTGSLIEPVHVLEGSVEFRVLAIWPGAAANLANTGSIYGISWWGVEKVPEPKR